MNNPSPLVPQGSILEQKNKSRARVRLAVFFILSIHVVGLMALLMQGCRKPPEPEPTQADTNPPPAIEATNPPAVDTNPPPAAVAPQVTEPAPGPAPGQEYVIAKGDTFSSIAKKFSVTVKAIEDANPSAQPTKLKPGQKIQIPAAAPAAPGAPSVTAPAPGVDAAAGGPQVYTVKSGDTLTKIAKQFGTSVSAVRSENNLTTDKIVVGQKLKIPAKAPAPAPAPAAPTATPTA
jgi:LysM repeat protein